MMRLVAQIAIVVSIVSSAACAAQEGIPSSGVLLALDSEQTIWIAPVNGKMQALARDELVIPRKEGFWRIRIQETPWPDVDPPDFDADNTSTKAALQPGSLWSVPLSRGPAAIPWEPQPAKIDPSKTDDNEEEPDSENQDDSAPPEQDDSADRDLIFLSPDFIALHSRIGEYSERYWIYRIREPLPGTSLLHIQEEQPTIPEPQKNRDLANCVDPNDELSTAEFLNGASEVSYGIVRRRREWAYVWLLGYEGGAARGYHTECPTSLIPPHGWVGTSDRYPSWKAIKAAFPEAQDAFTSPAHDMVLVVLANRLIVAPVRNGAVGKSLVRIESRAKPVMVEWALGKYVERWTKQLSPFFGPYKPKSDKIAQ